MWSRAGLHKPLRETQTHNLTIFILLMHWCNARRLSEKSTAELLTVTENERTPHCGCVVSVACGFHQTEITTGRWRIFCAGPITPAWLLKTIRFRRIAISWRRGFHRATCICTAFCITFIGDKFWPSQPSTSTSIYYLQSEPKSGKGNKTKQNKPPEAVFMSQHQEFLLSSEIENHLKRCDSCFVSFLFHARTDNPYDM